MTVTPAEKILQDAARLCYLLEAPIDLALLDPIERDSITLNRQRLTDTATSFYQGHATRIELLEAAGYLAEAIDGCTLKAMGYLKAEQIIRHKNQLVVTISQMLQMLDNE